MTIEEAINNAEAESLDDVIRINWQDRNLEIPSNISNIGVFNDADTNLQKFTMPRYFCGLDLSSFKIYINYLNANLKGDVCNAKDIKIYNEEITFNWLVPKGVYQKSGVLMFSVCLRLLEQESTIKELNTTIAKLDIYEGIEIELKPEEENQARNILLNMLNELTAKENIVINNIDNEAQKVIKSIPQDYTDLSNKVKDINTNIENNYANAIKLNASGTSITLTDSADAPIQNMEVHGSNLLDSSVVADGNSAKRTFKNVDTIKVGDTITYSAIASWTDDRTNARIAIQFNYKDGTISGNITNKYDAPSTRQSVSFRVDKPITSIILRGCDYSDYSSSTNTTIPNMSEEMLCIGTQTTYEPYKKYIDMEVCGKNFIKYPYKEKTKTVGGITFTDNGDGSITVNGTSTAFVFFVFFVLDNTGEFPIESSIGCVGLLSETLNGYTLSNGISTPIQGAGCFYNIGNKTLSLNINSGITFDNVIFKPMLEKGSVVTSYEPYKKQTATIDTELQTGWEELKTYYPITNIIPTQSATIDVEYVADTKNYVDKQVLEAIGNMVDLATMQMLDG